MHIRNGDKVFFENFIHAVNPTFFDMFSFPLLIGEKTTALRDPFSIVLTEETAEKLFGEEDPMDKTVLVENQWEMTVRGIIGKPPSNSTIQFDGLVRYEFARDQLERMPYGWVNAISTFAWLDVLVSAVVVLILAFRRVAAGEPRYWWVIAGTGAVGVSLGLPLYLYLAEPAERIEPAAAEPSA